MFSVFDVCRQITALDAARQLGLQLIQKGRRYWTRCPLHVEKTPSLLFDEYGRWYCFGCHSGGDAVELYAEFFHEQPYNAALHLAADFGISGITFKPRRAMPEKLFRRLAEDTDREKEHLLLLLKHSSAFIKQNSNGDILWDALQIETDADIELMNIDGRRIANKWRDP